MSAANCNAFLEQLDQWMEGERSPGAEAHIRSCTECGNLIADLDSIRDTASSLAADDSEPSARVWTALRAQLEDERLIHAAGVGSSGTAKRWLQETLWVRPRPLLAGAYLAALIAVGFTLSGSSSLRNDSNLWMSRTQRSTQPLSARLATEEDTISFMANANPAVTASLRKSLAVIDNNIALCEKSVREEPQNEFARDYLYEAYQQKADLIAQVTEGDEGQ
ncbi:MAG TPA: hypothetical protein VGR97_04440 [Candidatus Acidoferrales bacterium]|nr:hypothetical protein [Candidatus Acidoferrales bacterium]